MVMVRPGTSDPCPIDGVAFVKHSEIQMLGVPLGSDEFVASFVEKKLLGRLQSTVDKLVDFEDSQASSYLLRVSYSIVRAVHFMRTTPLHLWKQQATKFDLMIQKAIQVILGFPMNEVTLCRSASLPSWGASAFVGLPNTRTWLTMQVGMNLSRLPKRCG